MTDPPIHLLTIPDVVRMRAVTDAAHVALVIDGTRELTYGEWVARSSAVAHQLVDDGVRPADRVALLFHDEDWFGYAVANLAVYLAGATAVGLSARLTADDMRDRLRHCGTAGLIHGDGIEPPAFAGWARTVDDLDSGNPEIPSVTVAADQLVDILYTSGTTGAAKPVAVSHANATFAHTNQGQLFENIGTILCAIPLGTNAGHNAIMLALVARSTIHVLTTLEPELIAKTIEGLRLELAVMPPTTAIRLVDSGAHRAHDLTSLTTVMFGSAAVPLAVVSQLSEALPQVDIVIGYGSTESAPGLTALRVARWNDHGDPDYYQGDATATVGEPRRGTEVMIIDATGTSLPAGHLGEICLRSPAPPRSYYGDPEATARVFRDGWTRMGDLGFLDDHGLLHFFDRGRDAMTRNGTLVSSLRAENALYWHPDVVEAAVFGVPGPGSEQLVFAAVQTRTPRSETELRDFLATRLEPDELPSRIFVVPELPHGIIGKVLKRQLREQFADA